MSLHPCKTLSDGVPLAVFCGVPTSAIGSDAFQEAYSCTENGTSCMVKIYCLPPNEFKHSATCPKDITKLLSRGKPLLQASTSVFPGGRDSYQPIRSSKGDIPVCTCCKVSARSTRQPRKVRMMLDMHGSAYANLAARRRDHRPQRAFRRSHKSTHSPLPPGQQGRRGIIHFEIMPKNINSSEHTRHG